MIVFQFAETNTWAVYLSSPYCKIETALVTNLLFLIMHVSALIVMQTGYPDHFLNRKYGTNIKTFCLATLSC